MQTQHSSQQQQIAQHDRPSPYRTPPPKDARLAVALAFFFGPLGLLYSAPIAAIVTLLGRPDRALSVALRLLLWVLRVLCQIQSLAEHPIPL